MNTDLSPITTNILRASYENRQFSFGNPQAKQTVCLIGSCRIVPFLNHLRAYNAMYGNPYELLCFNPVEMWEGRPGCEVSDGVNRILQGYQIGKVDYLLCEHLERCGVLNTVRFTPENIFDSLGCAPAVEMRLPNWNDMHIFDMETVAHDKAGYGALGHGDRVAFIREQTAIHRARFLSHCRGCSFPELEAWVSERWLTVRMGCSSSHPSHPLLWRMFECVAERTGINLTPEFTAHPLCATEVYEPTAIPLSSVDYEANNWKF
jgi:hypothetical protein